MVEVVNDGPLPVLPIVIDDDVTVNVAVDKDVAPVPDNPAEDIKDEEQDNAEDDVV